MGRALSRDKQTIDTFFNTETMQILLLLCLIALFGRIET